MIKNTKTFFKLIYQKIIIFVFKIIYSTPVLKKKNVLDNSVKEIKIKIENNNYILYKLHRGSVYTDANDTTAYLSKNNLITKASMQFKKFDKINSFNDKLENNITLQIGTPKIRRKIKGNVLSLLSGGASRDNFTHWFTDIIPRIAIYSKKYNLKKIQKFYVPSVKYKYQTDSLKILGISSNKIISSEKMKHITADNIYATSHPCFYLPTKVKKWSLNFLNKNYKFKRSIKTYKNIFIDRDQFKLLDLENLKKYKNYRVLLNEKEIKNFVKSKGYKIIKPENYSLKDQVTIFSNASHVIGLYGAAMIMLAFCKKKTNIIEIKPIKGGNEFKNISKLKDLKHKQINLKPLFKPSTPQNGILYCPINKLKNI